MEKRRRARVILTTREKLTVWYSQRRASDAAEAERISVACPRCKSETFFLEFEQSEDPEIEISGIAEEFIDIDET